METWQHKELIENICCVFYFFFGGEKIFVVLKTFFIFIYIFGLFSVEHKKIKTRVLEAHGHGLDFVKHKHSWLNNG